jgi:hypothetical protein
MYDEEKLGFVAMYDIRTMLGSDEQVAQKMLDVIYALYDAGYMGVAIEGRCTPRGAQFGTCAVSRGVGECVQFLEDSDEHGDGLGHAECVAAAPPHSDLRRKVMNMFVLGPPSRCILVMNPKRYTAEDLKNIQRTGVAYRIPISSDSLFLGDIAPALYENIGIIGKVEFTVERIGSRFFLKNNDTGEMFPRRDTALRPVRPHDNHFLSKVIDGEVHHEEICRRIRRPSLAEARREAVEFQDLWATEIMYQREAYRRAILF